MEKFIGFILVVLVFVFALPTTVHAQLEFEPGCPIGFHLHNLMDHDDHVGMIHQHVGTAADQNSDGIVCVKHTSTQNHVHIDNAIPVQ